VSHTLEVVADTRLWTYRDLWNDEHQHARLQKAWDCRRVGPFHGMQAARRVISRVDSKVLMVDVPDLGYVSSSDPPQGEIWLRGANIFKG
jgi:hypothetical protein